MTKNFVVAILAGVILVTGSLAAEQDWPQWRGPSRDGVVAVEGVPDRWPLSLRAAWTVEIGEGYGSPVVANGRAFTLSRQDPREVVTAIDLSAGTVVWRQSYESAFEKNQYAVSMAKGPHATPLVSDGRVFTVGVAGIVYAWSAEDGAVLWRRDFSDIFDSSVLFAGTAASPLLADGMLVIQVGSDVQGGRIVALDPASGDERWTWRGPGPGYASPGLMEVDGVSHLVATTQESIVALDPRTGTLLWAIPFPDEWHENIVTPVWTGTELVMSGQRQGTHAYHLRQDRGAWRWTETWSNPDVTLYMSTPVLADGVLYGLSSKRLGQFVALDVMTGAVTWSSEGREGEHAVALLTPEHVVLLTNNAELTVARRNATTFEIERRYEVSDSQTWAVPVLLGRDLLIRDETHLVLLTPG